ncbi:cation/acetate symporter [Caldalkalibacillus uzonensis]|uniref:Cation/acetate symporter n=1 Tax=Caldalkalibacillus uzonensis TaxID=353224 RepID=A0ABU0CNJ5_9BACI|nr:cation acetate symporter [Caldalkalibacillus uzonensis]MDQ0337988.1 cation/acetate symporter [Caldalkalibacillus uzonensis]
MTLSTFVFFLAIIVGTLLITYWAARQTSSTHDYYAAGGQLTGVQNGLAIAGDYISAASFLGISGAIALYGFDGFFYSLGFLVSYLVLLILIAEPIRHLGKFTLGDVIAARFPEPSLRALTAMNTLFISILYMVAQLVAAGALLQLLLGLEYTSAVIIVGVLMTIYVVFGGMMATSWVQIVKTVLLVTGTLMFCLIILSRFEWDMLRMFILVTEATPLGEQFLHPGNMFTDPIDMLSLNLALIFGTAGLPHILIRCLTVKDAPAVRQSVISATLVMGCFYLMTIVLGLGAVLVVGYEQLVSIDPSGNMAAPLLAYALGGDFLMAFIAAIAFATILAVVCGVVIAASTAFAHDFYRHVLCKGYATEQTQMWVAKCAAIGVATLSIVLSIGLQSLNVAVIVSLIFCIAASVNFPVLLLTIFWRKFTVVGAVSAIVTGLISSVGLMLLSPNFSDLYGGLGSRSLMPLNNPGIITIPLSFVAAYMGSKLSPHLADEDRFESIAYLAQTGVKQNRS